MFLFRVGRISFPHSFLLCCCFYPAWSRCHSSSFRSTPLSALSPDQERANCTKHLRVTVVVSKFSETAFVNCTLELHCVYQVDAYIQTYLLQLCKSQYIILRCSQSYTFSSTINCRYVFCYDCITDYISSSGRCPLTCFPCSNKQLVRLFIDNQY